MLSMAMTLVTTPATSTTRPTTACSLAPSIVTTTSITVTVRSKKAPAGGWTGAMLPIWMANTTEVRTLRLASNIQDLGLVFLLSCHIWCPLLTPSSHLGGDYVAKDGELGIDNGIVWVTWHSRWYSLKETTMKLIPLSRLTAGGQTTGVKEFGGLESWRVWGMIQLYCSHGYIWAVLTPQQTGKFPFTSVLGLNTNTFFFSN